MNNPWNQDTPLIRTLWVGPKGVRIRGVALYTQAGQRLGRYIQQRLTVPVAQISVLCDHTLVAIVIYLLNYFICVSYSQFDNHLRISIQILIKSHSSVEYSGWTANTLLSLFFSLQILMTLFTVHLPFFGLSLLHFVPSSHWHFSSSWKYIVEWNQDDCQLQKNQKLCISKVYCVHG